MLRRREILQYAVLSSVGGITSGCIHPSESGSTDVYITQKEILFRNVDSSVSGQIEAENVSVVEDEDGSVDEGTKRFSITGNSGKLSFKNGSLKEISFQFEKEGNVYYNADIIETNVSRFSREFDARDVLDSSILDGSPSLNPGRELGDFCMGRK